MSSTIVKINLELQTRTIVDTINNHTDMNEWLRNKGEKNFIYEIWKINGLHSRWIWKNKKEKWGRLSTPKNNN